MNRPNCIRKGNTNMDVVIKLFQTQWMFIVAAVVIVAAMFVIKKFIPQIYKTFCIVALAVTVIALVLLAVAFKLPDLFLLIPIFMLCCELFGYEITGKIVAVFLADYILICILNFAVVSGWINDVINTIIFFGLQVVTAVGAGLVLDRHLTNLKKKKQLAVEENKKAELAENEKLDSHIDDVFEKYALDSDLPEDSGDDGNSTTQE